jgi:hypothetical protein
MEGDLAVGRIYQADDGKQWVWTLYSTLTKEPNGAPGGVATSLGACP